MEELLAVEESVVENLETAGSQGTCTRLSHELLLHMEKMMKDASQQQEHGIDRICLHIDTSLAQQKLAITKALNSHSVPAPAEGLLSIPAPAEGQVRSTMQAQPRESALLNANPLFRLSIAQHHPIPGRANRTSMAQHHARATKIEASSNTLQPESHVSAPGSVMSFDDVYTDKGDRSNDAAAIESSIDRSSNRITEEEEDDEPDNDRNLHSSEATMGSTLSGRRMQRYSQHESDKKQVATNDGRKFELSAQRHSGTIADERPLFRRLLDSTWFDGLCATVLLSNAVFMGIQLEHRAATRSRVVPSEHLTIEILYTVFFVAELSLRFYGLGVSKFFLGPERNWNIFDFVVVFIGALENLIDLIFQGDTSSAVSSLSVLRTVRIVRVVRVVRVVRLMKFFRSLRMLINAILNTVKNCLWTSLLLCMILYIFGILFAQQTIDYLLETDPQLLKDREMTPLLRHYFSTVPRSCFTCLKSILGGIDWEPAAQALSDLGGFYVFMFILLVLFVYLAVLNVISGLFLQSSIEEAQLDLKHIMAMEVNEKAKFTDWFEDVFNGMDTDQTGDVSLDEFEHALDKPGMQDLLKAMGVEAPDAWELFKLLDTDGCGSVCKEEFLEGCLSLKGPAKSIHIAQQRYESKWLIEAVMRLSTFVEEATQESADRQGVLLEKLQLATGSPMGKLHGTSEKQRPTTATSSELS